MIQVNRIYLIFNRLVTKKFLVDTSENMHKNSVEEHRCTDNTQAGKSLYCAMFNPPIKTLRL